MVDPSAESAESEVGRSPIMVNNSVDASTVYGSVLQMGSVSNFTLEYSPDLASKRFEVHQDFCTIWKYLEMQARRVAAALWAVDDPVEYTAEADEAKDVLNDLSHCSRQIVLLDGGDSPSSRVVVFASRAVYSLHPLILTELVTDAYDVLTMLRDPVEHRKRLATLKEAGEHFEAFLCHAGSRRETQFQDGDANPETK